MTESWARLFERADAVGADLAAVREALQAHREGNADRAGSADSQSADEAPDDPAEPSPARVVADADVLAADLLVGGPARAALDHVRRHSWVRLVASDPLLADAVAVVETLAGGGGEDAGANPDATGGDSGDADPALGSDWRERVARDRHRVVHPPDDHPGLASAYRGGAMHLLSYDERLGSAAAGAQLQGRVSVSVRPPDAFARLFDAASLHSEVVGGAYPGPDRDPRE